MNINDKTNSQHDTVKILDTIKDQIAEESKKYTYSFDQEKDNLRTPNESEVREWMKERLYLIYMESDIMTVSQYRSLKGEIMHYKYTGVLNFLKKRGYSNINKEMETYTNSRTFSTVAVKVQFPNVVKSEIIEIDIKKDEV